MNRLKIFLAISLMLATAGVSQATHDQDDNAGGSCDDFLAGILERDSLTDNFCGLNDPLGDQGLELDLSVTNIFQQNLNGGRSTQAKAGHLSGSYDLELSWDPQPLLNITGASLYMLAEGSWPSTPGINDTMVGSIFGVNGDAGGHRSIDVTELWYEQALLDGLVRVRLGKIDLTGGFECHGCPVSFDCSNFANNETSQFLNSALVNNPTIPFPDNGLAAAIHFNFIKWWYISIGAADSQADVRRTGFKTTFDGDDAFIYLMESGFTPQLESPCGPLQGAYRFGVWFDDQPKLSLADPAVTYADDVGFYLSFDQVLMRENAQDQDSQGLGAFVRWGWANSNTREITNFWSAGAQYQGLVPGRDDDVVALGAAQGIFSDNVSLTRDNETALELYYSAPLTGWITLTPSVQYICNTGGNNDASDALVVGARMQMAL